MKHRFAWLVMALTLVTAFVVAPFSASAATGTKPLKNVPVTGTLADGGTFTGKLTVTEFGYDQATGLNLSGVLKGQAVSADGTKTTINQSFSNVHATLNEASQAGAITTQAICDILFLDLGPLNLDLLGLTVDLSEITLDINAVSGPGNLLGNLLCAVAGLLDPGGFLNDLIGGLTGLLNLLNTINGLL